VITHGINGLEYIIWLDSDSYFPVPVLHDVVSIMRQNQYAFGFSHWIREPLTVVAGMYDWTVMHMAQKDGVDLVDFESFKKKHSWFASVKRTI
jgi:hypothetical protein